eukprot:2808295-Alexandrium_andersonii.AAC.1
MHNHCQIAWASRSAPGQAPTGEASARRLRGRPRPHGRLALALAGHSRCSRPRACTPARQRPRPFDGQHDVQ